MADSNLRYLAPIFRSILSTWGIPYVPRTRVVIEIAPSLLCVATHAGGGCLASRSIPLPYGEWPSPWHSLLDQTREQLLKLVAELGCTGANCRIVCQSPGAVVGTSMCAVSAGLAAAQSAATLQLSSIASSGLDAAGADVHRLFQDAPEKSPKSPPQIHTVAAVDTDENLRRLSEWAESAGLKVEGISPTEAVAACAAARTLSAASCEADLSATLWITEHLGVLVVGNASRLLYIRTVGFGTETLVDALMKPLRAPGLHAGPESQPITLDREQARSLLHSVGIPSPEQPLDNLPGLTGAAALPGLQPALQRLAVEIKQSLRFGVRDELRAGVKFNVQGPGAAVPRLAATLARLSGIETPSEAQPAPESVVSAYARIGSSCPSLACTSTTDQFTLRRVRRALLAGVGAAACLLAIEGGSAYMDLHHERTRLAAVRARCDGDAALADAQKTSLDARVAATALEHQVAHRLGSTAPWGRLLACIAEAVPTDIRLTSIRLVANDSRSVPACTLRGYVRSGEGADSAAEIKSLADSLQAVPLVGAVRLGSTARSSMHGAEVRTFELTLDVVAIPGFTSAVAGGQTEESTR